MKDLLQRLRVLWALTYSYENRKNAALVFAGLRRAKWVQVRLTPKWWQHKHVASKLGRSRKETPRSSEELEYQASQSSRWAVEDAEFKGEMIQKYHLDRLSVPSKN